jgi:GxxExxY protein
MAFTPLSEKEERMARKIVDAANAVHKTLGPGLLEKVYEVCLTAKRLGSLINLISI